MLLVVGDVVRGLGGKALNVNMDVDVKELLEGEQGSGAGLLKGSGPANPDSRGKGG